MLEAGIRVLLEPGLEDLKRPRFDHNQTMLDGFVSTTSEGVFLTSSWRATWFKKDYKGTEGRQATAHHSLRWIQTECANRGLVAEEIKEKAYNFGNQTWIRIKPRSAG